MAEKIDYIASLRAPATTAPLGHHMVRPRVVQALARAAQGPLALVCAGAGYGKTRAVSDFIRASGFPCAWLQVSQRDNSPAHFWENFAGALATFDTASAVGPPRPAAPVTEERLARYIRRQSAFIRRQNRKYILVLDDVHLLSEPSALRFLEQVIHDIPDNMSIFLLCRRQPQVNVIDLDINGLMAGIHEEELCFTPTELSQYSAQQAVNADKQTLGEIFKDTKGWPFAINFVMRSLKKSPIYVGYVQNALRQNMFKLMQMEAWDAMPDSLKHFLLRLSLTNHLSADWLATLAGEAGYLLNELEGQCAYMRYDSHTGTYIVHPLLMEFLRARQNLLSEEEMRQTHQSVAEWCHRNGFKTDALNYYEKTSDYGAIVQVLESFPGQMPADIAEHARGIFAKAPKESTAQVKPFVAQHLRCLMSLGLWGEATAMAQHYEGMATQSTASDADRSHILASVYFAQGNMRLFMGIQDDVYSFDAYFAKADTHLRQYPEAPRLFPHFHLGTHAVMVGVPRQCAPQEFCEALANTLKCFPGGRLAGLEELCLGEVKFYQGDIPAAEMLFLHALERARPNGQGEIMHRALHYLLRVAVSQGNHAKAQQLLGEYAPDSEPHQTALGWYYCLLRQPQLVPAHLQGSFTPYIHPAFKENLGNQIKARQHFLSQNYPPLRAYIQGLKERETVLFCRLEMLAVEACLHFKAKARQPAFTTLHEAYQMAQPNNILMPFIELGKDMRTLTASALRGNSSPIPRPWLEMVNRRAATYAKHQSQAVFEYKKANDVVDKAALSPLEMSILRDLVNGLSRTEMATNQGLSINTVNSVMTSIYTKLNARNVIDAVRVVFEQKLL